MDQHKNLEDIIAIQSHLKPWENVPAQDLEFTRLGGLTNEMWKVMNKNPSAHPQAVILRKFGAGNDVIDRERENTILKALADHGVGAKLYAGTNAFRIEKFYPSSELTPSKVNETLVRRELAMNIAKFHKVKIPEFDNTPMSLKVLEDKSFYIEKAERKAQRDLYTPIERKLLDQIMTLTGEEEITFLKKILPKNEKSIVFSHNDIHSQNVLVLNKTNKLMLIDYEYSDYNYRGFDIANLFNEAMFDYHTPTHPYYILDESKFPSEENLKDVIKYYLFFNKFDINDDEVKDYLEDSELLDRYILTHDNMDSFMEEIEALYEEIKVCRLLSHYFWILWSIIMSRGNDVEFDYIHFAYKRFELYHKLKREYFQSI